MLILPWYKFTCPNKPAASNAGSFRRWALIKLENNRGKENNKQVNPALAAAGRPLAPIYKNIIHAIWYYNLHFYIFPAYFWTK